MEILVGILLLGGGVLLALALFPTAYSSLGQAKNLTQATNLAREVLEQQKAAGYARVDDVAERKVSLPIELNGQTSYQEFVYESEQMLSSDRRFRAVSVTVRWRVGAVERSFRLDTILVP